MCEYCGCQNVAAIAALTAEHDELREMAREATGAARLGDRAAAAGVAGRMLTLLRPHTEIEERALFPAMAAEFAEHVGTLRDDHQRIAQTLAGVAARSAGSERWAEDLESALADLFAHILREQDGLFPAALSLLRPAQWDELEAVRTEVRQRSAADTGIPEPLSLRTRPGDTVQFTRPDHFASGSVSS